MNNINEIESLKKKFNWGAACLGLVWSIFNSCFPIYFKLFVLFYIIPTIIVFKLHSAIWPLGNGLEIVAWLPVLIAWEMIPLIGFSIFVGLNGYKWAIESQTITDLNKFKENQKTWNIIAIVLLATQVGFPLLMTFLSMIIALFKVK